MIDTLKRHAGWLGAALLVLALALGVVTWQLNQSGSASTGPKRAFVNGALNYPAAVRAKLDRLNNTLDRCLLRHGAKRMAAGRAWTYRDPDGKANAACTIEQAAVNAYADSDDVQRANRSLEPALRAYAECMQRHGIALAYHIGTPVPSAAAMEKANAACGGPTAAPTPGG